MLLLPKNINAVLCAIYFILFTNPLAANEACERAVKLTRHTVNQDIKQINSNRHEVGTKVDTKNIVRGTKALEMIANLVRNKPKDPMQFLGLIKTYVQKTLEMDILESSGKKDSQLRIKAAELILDSPELTDLLVFKIFKVRHQRNNATSKVTRTYMEFLSSVEASIEGLNTALSLELQSQFEPLPHRIEAVDTAFGVRPSIEDLQTIKQWDGSRGFIHPELRHIAKDAKTAAEENGEPVNPNIEGDFSYPSHALNKILVDFLENNGFNTTRSNENYIPDSFTGRVAIAAALEKQIRTFLSNRWNINPVDVAPELIDTLYPSKEKHQQEVALKIKLNFYQPDGAFKWKSPFVDAEGVKLSYHNKHTEIILEINHASQIMVLDRDLTIESFEVILD